MGDSCFKQNFKCPCCNTITKDYIWLSDLEKGNIPYVCTKEGCEANDKPLEPFYEEVPQTPMIIGRRMNKAEIKADRRQRSKDHFQREVLPYLPPIDQIHFVNKGYKPK